MMKQQKLNRFTLMGTFLVILSLALAACAPAGSASGTPASLPGYTGGRKYITVEHYGGDLSGQHKHYGSG